MYPPPPMEEYIPKHLAPPLPIFFATTTLVFSPHAKILEVFFNVVVVVEGIGFHFVMKKNSHPPPTALLPFFSKRKKSWAFDRACCISSLAK